MQKKSMLLFTFWNTRNERPQDSVTRQGQTGPKRNGALGLFLAVRRSSGCVDLGAPRRHGGEKFAKFPRKLRGVLVFAKCLRNFRENLAKLRH